MCFCPFYNILCGWQIVIYQLVIEIKQVFAGWNECLIIRQLYVKNTNNNFITKIS